ncbi:MAG: SAM-dependent methyltransferase [Acidobacteriota bacterium]|nr:SAM-dependent methyltransferase [Acidobacteriota bacterium]
MKSNRPARFIFGAVLSLAVALAAAASGSEVKGKFLIVGMGTAPDLITLRAVEAVRGADIIILHDEQGLEDWKSLIGAKDAWILPRYRFIYLGVKPEALADPKARALAEENAKAREDMVARIRGALDKGRTVAVLEGGDPMMYGVTWYLEALPADTPSEIIPGVGALQAAAAAVKANLPYGWDTSAVIMTMADWEGRADVNEKLMAAGSTLAFYTMHLDYEKLFEQLRRHYPAETPVAVVSYAGDREKERVQKSTVGRFSQDIRVADLPADAHMLLVGKFLTAGQARKDGLESGRAFIESMRFQDRVPAKR